MGRCRVGRTQILDVAKDREGVLSLTGGSGVMGPRSRRRWSWVARVEDLLPTAVEPDFQCNRRTLTTVWTPDGSGEGSPTLKTDTTVCVGSARVSPTGSFVLSP